jgi:hypothetical protein
VRGKIAPVRRPRQEPGSGRAGSREWRAGGQGK